MDGGARRKSSAPAACVAVAVAAAGLLGACSNAPTRPAAGSSPTATPSLSSTTTTSSEPVLSSSGVAAYASHCTVTLTGSKVVVAFALPDLDTCRQEIAQLRSVVGGDWQEQQGATTDVFVAVTCIVHHGGVGATVVDERGGTNGYQICRQLLAAGWVENSETMHPDN